jgi:LysM repeat protein
MIMSDLERGSFDSDDEVTVRTARKSRICAPNNNTDKFIPKLNIVKKYPNVENNPNIAEDSTVEGESADFADIIEMKLNNEHDDIQLIEKIFQPEYAASSTASLALPTAPDGFVWILNPDETCSLVAKPGVEPSGLVSKQLVIEHLVMPDDTLQGICLRYNTSTLDVKRRNYLSSNAISHLRILKIAVKPYTSFKVQLASEDVILQKFQNATHEQVTESRLYLEESGYDLDKALHAWKLDEEWVKANNEGQRNRIDISKVYDSPVIARRKKAADERDPLLSTSLRRRVIKKDP